jgi:hypothetical protein
MKRFAVLASVVVLVAAGCNKSINPVVPSGIVVLTSTLTGASNVPPAGYAGGASALEAGSNGSVQITLTPAADGSYTASISLRLGGLITRATSLSMGLPYPLDNGSLIIAGMIHQGGTGTPGPAVLALPISQTAPIFSPDGTVQVTIKNVAVSSATAASILANAPGFYFNLYSYFNQTGVMRGQLVKLQ